MSPDSGIRDLLRELNELDEHPRLDAKACSHGELGDSFFETVCAYSNEPGLGGGTLLLGVRRDESDLFGGYEVVGVKDPDKLLQDIASGCAERFDQPVRPYTCTELVEGKVVIQVDVPEMSPSQKPLYFRKHGIPRGAWRRVGSTDQRCTEDDMVLFYSGRQGESYDLRILPNADLDDLDPQAVEHYRRLRAKVNPDAEELQWEDLEMLRALNAVRKHEGKLKVTMTGLLLFGTRQALRRELPAVRIDYIRVSGKEWIRDPENRFTSTIDMRGPLLQLVERAQSAVMDDLPKGFELKEGALQAETPTLPSRVLREALVNAVMHRSYREHQPTQIIRYANRIEITNVGFSLKNEDQLGEPGSQMRNPYLAAVFHETNLAETKGSGIRVMREQMKASGFSPPTFDSDRENNTFTTRLLLHHFLQKEDWDWLAQIEMPLTDGQRTALIFLREQGAINNQTLRQLTGEDVLTASQELRKLRDANILEAKGKGSATYYVPGAAFPKPATAHPAMDAEHPTLAPEHPTLAPEHPTLAPEHPTLEGQDLYAPPELPSGLRNKVEALGKRPGDKIRPLIREICEWKPMTGKDLAQIFHRDEEALRRDHLKPMVKEESLFLLYPMEKHPQQAYTTEKR